MEKGLAGCETSPEPAATRHADHLQLAARPRQRGEAIAICHDRKNTAAVLARELPKMAGEGIEFVRLSEMVKK